MLGISHTQDFWKSWRKITHLRPGGIYGGKILLLMGLRRRIGNKQNTLTFEDPWIPRSPSFLPITRGLNDDMRVFKFIQLWNHQLLYQHYLIPDSELIL